MAMRWFNQGLLGAGLLLLATAVVALRLGSVTDHLQHGMLKDPPRAPPEGPYIVAPADGTVLYVRRVEGGLIPEVVKQGVAVPIAEHLKTSTAAPGTIVSGPAVPSRGVLIGIYMNTQGVHVNRIPSGGRVKRQIIFNGPHMDVSDAEVAIITGQLVPGWTSVKKLFGLPPFDIQHDADFILKSARETLVLEDERGREIYLVRIADYYVGKILTWVREGQAVQRGQRLGMIVWGSQTDIYIEDSEGLTVDVGVGEYVYGGETIVASY